MDYFFYNTDANSLSRDGRFPILIKGGFAATSGPRRFGEKLDRLSPGDAVLMYENGRGVVAVGIVCEHWDRKTHRPPLYYQPGDDGFDHEYRIEVDWFLDLSDNPVSVKELKQRASTPRGAINRIVKWRHEIEAIIEERSTPHSFPGEVPESSSCVEGATRRISVNAYERNPVARSRCIDHYGKTCVVCGFNFGETYGSLAEGFIHVHHLKPLSEIGEEYEVDPIADLRPVCPNCHAVIHLGGECRTIEEIRKLRKQK
jgi:hypothetical protein